MRKRFKRVAYTAAAAATGIAVPFTGVVAPSVMAVAHAADPEWHTATVNGVTFGYTESTIDKTKKGTIKIYKYEENNGKMTEGTGFADDKAGENRRPISGVQFKGLKIADIVTVAGNGLVGTYYTNLSGKFRALLNDYSLTNVPVTKDFGQGADSDKNGKYYTTDSIEKAMKLLNEATAPSNPTVGGSNEYPGQVGTNNTLSGVSAITNTIEKADNSVNFGYTNADGFVEGHDLDLGLYMIAETDYRPKAVLNKNSKLTTSDGNGAVPDEYPHGAKYSDTPGQDVKGDTSQNHQDVETPAIPYLVSVPMTNVVEFTDGAQQKHDPGTVWFYDLTTYPKNQTTNITKKIIDPDPKDMMDENDTKIGVKGDPKQGDNVTKSLEDYETYSMGDTVHQVIYADAAANMELQEVDTKNNPDGKSTRAQQNPNRYTTYSIADEMTDGLQFDGVTKVVYGKKVDPKKVGDFSHMQELKLNEDYVVRQEPIKVNPMTRETFDQNQARLDKELAQKDAAHLPTKKKFCVQLTSKGIAKLNALKEDSQVVVFFDSQVTPKAKIGTTDKNVNQAHLEVKHEFTSTLDKMSNETRIFTFEIDATKKAEDSTNPSTGEKTKLPDDFHPERTAFTVKQVKHEGDGWASKDDTRAATKNIQLDNNVKVDEHGNEVAGATLDTDWNDTDFVKFVKEEDGVYHVYSYLDEGDAAAAKAGQVVTIIHPNKDGKLQMKGLDDAKYTVTERKTQDHYSLQKSSFDIDLRAATQTDANDYRSENVLARQAKNALHYEHVNGKLTDASKIYTDDNDKGAALPLGGLDDAKNEGIVHFVIYNGMTPALRTGGKGVTGIYIAAAGTGAAVAAAYVIKRKKDQKAER